MERGNVRYLFGDDTYQARIEINNLAQQLAARIRLLDQDEVKERSPAGWINQGGNSLFGTELLVFRGVSSWSKDLQDQLTDSVSDYKGSELVVWDQGVPDKRTRLYKSLKSCSTEFGVWPRPRLAQWLIEEAKKEKVEFSFDVANRLIDRVGDDRWRLLSELKLLLLRHKKPTVNDVDKDIAKSSEAEVFALLDGLIRRDKQFVLNSVQTLLDSGESEFYVMSMLAYQFRTLLLIRTGIDQHKTQFDLVREAKLKQFVVQKNFEMAKRKPSSYWRDRLTRILATDFAIRQGVVEARTALLMLVIGLLAEG